MQRQRAGGHTAPTTATAQLVTMSKTLEAVDT